MSTSLSRDTIVGAAVALGDEGGSLETVTFRAVGARLGVTAMALYRYVESKDALLDAMAEHLYGELELPRPGTDWWEGIATIARSARAVLLRHPWAFPLLARPLSGPNGHALDAALEDSLRRAGFTEAESRELHDQLSGMALALILPELRGQPDAEAFERGLEILHAGLAARARR